VNKNRIFPRFFRIERFWFCLLPILDSPFISRMPVIIRYRLRNLIFFRCSSGYTSIRIVNYALFSRALPVNIRLPAVQFRANIRLPADTVSCQYRLPTELYLLSFSPDLFSTHFIMYRLYFSYVLYLLNKFTLFSVFSGRVNIFTGCEV
jgi:hypothetical protein